MARVKATPRRNRSGSTTFMRGRGTTRYGRVKARGRRRRSRPTKMYSLNVGRRLTPFPGMVIKRHRYIETITVATAGGAGIHQSYTFSANSTYDPNITGTGHQPLFRDEMAANYQNYTVLKSYISWIIPNNNTELVAQGCYTDDAAFSTSPGRDVLSEQRGVSTNMKTSTQNFPTILRGWYDAAKWYKTTYKGLMSDDTKKNDKNYNASQPVYYHYWRYPMDPTVQLDAIYVRVVVTYIVAWRDPVVNTGS